ncbi:MAG: nucleotidyltransferase domain-containing protein [Hydrogenothermaceae bacterium]|nr:nucleotidyltransferase domain-containing protein [Hydrogenothermaceae bacterium]
MLSFKGYSKEDYIQMLGQTVDRVLGGECLIIFFGSITDDRFSKISDIDIAVMCNNEISAIKMLELEEEIEKLPILKEVDIVDIRKVKNPEFLKNISRGLIWKSSTEVMKDFQKLLRNLKK